MKKLLFAIFLAFLYSVSAYGQVPTNIPNTVIQVFPGAPTGACLSVMVATRQDTGAFYDCFGGAWAPVGGAGAGANSSLSNLSNPTSVNQSLIPGTTGLTLGTQANPWANVYMQNLTFPGLDVGFFCFPGTLPTPPTGYGGLGCIDSNGLLDEYNIGASAWQPLVSGGTANQIDVSATTGNASFDPNIILTNQTMSISNPGSFTTGASILSYENTEIGGCVPDTMYAQVQFNHTATVGKSICNINTTGSGANLVMGLFVATSQDVANVDSNAASLYSFCTVNNCHINVLNPVAQDISGLTSGVQMTGEEIDIQFYNGPSAYSAIDGLRISPGTFMAGNPGGNYPMNGIHFTAGDPGGATLPPTYNRLITADVSTLGTNGVGFYVGAVGPTVSGTNFGGPIILSSEERFWTTSAQNALWNMQVRIGTGNNPTFDELYIFQSGSFNQIATHYVVLQSYQNMFLGFQGSGGGFIAVGEPNTNTANGTFYFPSANGIVTGDGWPSAPSTLNCVAEMTSVTANTKACSEIVDAASGGAIIGSPTGGAQGSGTLNATGLFVNGVAVGGANIAGGVLGSAVYQSGVGATSVTAANTSATTECLTETGTGTVGAAPVWGACSGSAATAWSAITAGANTETSAFSTTAPWTFSDGMTLAGGLAGGASGLQLTGGGTNQNITLTPGGTGLVSATIVPTSSAIDAVTITDSYAGSTTAIPLALLAPSIGNASNTELVLGVATSNTNGAFVNFHYVANNNAGNYAEIGVQGNAGLQIGSTGGLNAASLALTAAAPTVSAAQIGYGSTTAAVANCGSAGPTACIVVNVAGTVHYVPYY